MPYSGQVIIHPPGGDGARASVDVLEDAVAIAPEGGSPVHLPFVDIDDVHDDDYTLRLTDYTGRRYDLTMLGKAYGQVLADVRKRRIEVLQHDLLLTGVNLRDTFPGKLFTGAEPVPVQIRLFEDLMVIIPERGTMFGIPYSFVDEVTFDEALYQTHVRTDDGTKYVFGHLKLRSQEFPAELRRLLDALSARTARALGQLLGGVPPEQVSRLAAQMRDGRAVQQRAVDAIDPGLWPRLEEAVVGTDELRQSYDRLKEMCPPGWAALGIKAVLTEAEPDDDESQSGYEAAPASATDQQGRLAQNRQIEQQRQDMGSGGGMPTDALMGQMKDLMAGVAEDAAQRAADRAVAGAADAQVGDAEESADAGAEQGEGPEKPASVLWYFMPLADGRRPLNAVAQEVTSEGGKATYVFRLLDQHEFISLDGEELAAAVTAAISRLNRALLTLNFRREPIYLADEQINTGKYARYRVALRKLDYLRWARSAFLGRAIHNESWEQQLLDAAKRA